MNPELLKFIAAWEGPPNEAYFERIRELEVLQSVPQTAEEVRDADETRAPETPPGAGRWEKPVPLSPVTTLPTFPTAAFPGWVRDYVESEAVAVQIPVDMSAMFALGMLATVAGGRVEVEPREAWLEGVNLYIVVAMEPGSRKSAVHRDMSAPILEFERLLAEEVRPDVAEQASIRRIAEQALTRAEKTAASAKDHEQRREREEDARQAAAALERLEVAVAPRLFTSDATPEALGSLLHENRGRIAILSAEAGVFGVMAGRYGRGGSPNLDVYLAGHAGDPIRVDRRGRPREFVDRPSLTVCLACQPFVLRQAAQVVDLAGRGLLDRFLYAMPAGNVGYRLTSPPLVPAEVKRRYDTSLRAMAASHEGRDEPLVLKFSDEAISVLDDWREILEPRRRPHGDLGGIMQGWSSKLDGATVRIAALLHLAAIVETGVDDAISAETMTDAVTIARYLIPHARAAYDHMGTDPRIDGARHLLEWLRKAGKPTFTKREAHSANTSRFRRSADLDPVLRLLEVHGYIRELPRQVGPKGGRPSQRFSVHPDLQNLAKPTEPEPSTSSVGIAGSVTPNGNRPPSHHVDPVSAAAEDGWVEVSPPEPLSEWPDPIDGDEL